jgi:phage terminase Nu1 subunit (DNA packaging protein)
MPTSKPNLGARVSKQDLMDLTGMALKTITKRLEDVKPLEVTGREVYYRPREALPALYNFQNPQAERIRLDSARAEAQEMKNAVARGELIPGEEVSRIGTAVMSTVKMRVMALRTLGPAVRAAESDGEASALIESAAREALSELAALGEIADRARARESRVPESEQLDLDRGDTAAEADDERVG